MVLLACGTTLRAKEYNILDFGADNSGRELTTAAIQKAVDQCYYDGGGRVYVPAGEYLVGTIVLRSNVDFHIEKGATLAATLDLSQYRKDNNGLAGVFFAENSENISLTGGGRIFGRGMEFMYADSAKVISGEVLDYTRQGKDFRRVEGGRGDGPLYPGDRFQQMIIFSRCTGVTIKDIEVVDAPYWTFLIVHCKKVRVTGITIDNNLLIPNSDGLDIISSSDVNVSDCVITCGDDAIVLSGYAHHFGDPGYKDIREPSTNINISNCTLQSRSSGIRIGGWDQNPMSNYNFSNINIFDSNCGINITVRDSGGAENLNFSDIRIETRLHTGDWWGNGEPIKISAMRGVPDNPIGFIRNIFFNNVTCVGENSILLYASDESVIENIFFTGFDFILRGSPLDESGGGNFDLRPNTVPGMELFKSDVPVVYAENVRGLHFDRGNIDWRGMASPFHTHGIEAVKVDGLRIQNTTVSPSPANPKLPAVKLISTVNVVDKSKK